MPRCFLSPGPTAFLAPFLEEKPALEDFQTGHKDGPTGPNSVPEAGTLFAENGTIDGRDALPAQSFSYPELSVRLTDLLRERWATPLSAALCRRCGAIARYSRQEQC